jgi:hypothetical protein
MRICSRGFHAVSKNPGNDVRRYPKDAYAVFDNHQVREVDVWMAVMLNKDTRLWSRRQGRKGRQGQFRGPTREGRSPESLF